MINYAIINGRRVKAFKCEKCGVLVQYRVDISFYPLCCNCQNNGFNRDKEYKLLKAVYGSHCQICGTHESTFKKKLHVDHNHETGRIRGLLCDNCNRAIGHLKDNPHITDSATRYLRRFLPKNPHQLEFDFMEDEVGSFNN